MAASPNTIARPKAAARHIGVSISTLYRWERERPDFPRRIKLGPRASGWRLADLESWLERQARCGEAAA